MHKKYYVWNPATYNCKNGKYLASVIADSVIMCDEIIYTTKTVSTKTASTPIVPTKVTSANFYILLTLLLITITLLTAVSIYCDLIKYWIKQKDLLPYHVINNKLKEALYEHKYYEYGK